MKYYLISIGGTGAKCLEAFVHMNAAGLMRDSGEINIIYVDPDASNGNLAKAKNTVRSYIQAYNGMSQDSFFFKNPLKQAEKTWNPVPNTAQANLKTIFERYNMDVKAENLHSLFDVLFSEEEQNTLLTEGFRAHPSIGAAVIGANMNMDEQDSVWKNMVTDIGEQEARIFFFGSVFGGTGAAGFPNIAKIIRNYFNDRANNPERIKMAGCLMLPYFQFPPASEEDMKDPNDPDKKIIVPDSGKFLASTYAALNYYDTNNLVGNVFDAIYLVGDRQFVNISEFKAGQAEQRNKANYVEMIAALSALEFFNKESNDSYFRNPDCYMLAMHNRKFSWQDLPPVYPGCTMENKLKSFIRMVYMYRSYVFPKMQECRNDERQYRTNVWIDGYLYQMIERIIIGPKREGFIDDTNDRIGQDFHKYCVTFLDWLKDLTYSSEAAENNNLRCAGLVNNNIHKYDDTSTFEENCNDLTGGRAVVKAQDIFPEDSSVVDDGRNSFVEKMIDEAKHNDEVTNVGMKALLAMVYDVSKDGRTVE